MMWQETDWQLQKLYLADYLGQLYTQRSEPFSVLFFFIIIAGRTSFNLLSYDAEDL
jgi:hypothetical protein